MLGAKYVSQNATISTSRTVSLDRGMKNVKPGRDEENSPDGRRRGEKNNNRPRRPSWRPVSQRQRAPYFRRKICWLTPLRVVAEMRRLFLLSDGVMLLK